jgi:hypothetical protein
MNHTPGPWTIRESATHITVIGSNNETIFHDDKRCPSVPEDARLISAAPDLLEALDLLLRYSLSHPIHTDQSQFGNVYDKARAAIAKARGTL